MQQPANLWVCALLAALPSLFLLSLSLSLLFLSVFVLFVRGIWIAVGAEQPSSRPRGIAHQQQPTFALLRALTCSAPRDVPHELGWSEGATDRRPDRTLLHSDGQANRSLQG